MDGNEYQKKVATFAVYPSETKGYYLSLGLAGEVGEFCNKVKKLLRGDELYGLRKALFDELGDICWYLAEICNWFGFSLSDVMRGNIEKLEDRKLRDAIKGSGDDR